MDPLTGPLTDDHYAQIKSALEASKLIQYEIDRAKAAGMDVSQRQAELNKAVDQLVRFKQVYFPNR